MEKSIALSFLARGSEVTRLQLMLREIGYQLEPDGFFGPITRCCVTTFQATHALDRTGRVDPAAWSILESCALARRLALHPLCA